MAVLDMAGIVEGQSRAVSARNGAARPALKSQVVGFDYLAWYF